MNIYLLKVLECTNTVYLRSRGNPVGSYLQKVYNEFAGDTFKCVPSARFATVYDDKKDAQTALAKAYHHYFGFVFDIITFVETA